MKRVLAWMSAAVLLAACRFGTAPSAPSPAPTVWPTSTSVPPADLTPAQIVALGKLSDSLRLPLDQIALVSAESVDWPDTCLGIVHAGLGCAAAVTPGYRIVLEANRVRYEYHLNAKDLKQITGASLALTWRRAGPPGVCDTLEVYLSGEVYASACQAAPFPMTTLSLAELQQVAAWVRTLGRSVMAGSAGVDGQASQLSFYGAGAAAAGPADRDALFNFAQTLYDKNKPCC